MKDIDSNSPQADYPIPQELLDAEINLRMKHMDIEACAYFAEDFEEGAYWAQQQMGNLAIEFTNYAINSIFGGDVRSTLDIYKEFIKYKENGDKD